MSTNALDWLDDKLRALLNRKNMRGWVFLCIGYVAMTGFLLTRDYTYLEPGNTFQRVVTVLMFSLLVVLFAYPIFRRIAKANGDVGLYLLSLGGCMLLVLVRLALIEKISVDYVVYFSKWHSAMKPLTFGEAMRANVGDYTMPYMYLTYLMTRVPMPDLYVFKYVTMLFEAWLANEVVTLADISCEKESLGRSLMLYFIVLMLPSVLLNGAHWGQCDAIYTTFALYGLRTALQRKPCRAAFGFAMSFAFKLQAVFLFPILPILWCTKRLKLKHALLLVGIWAAAMLPALFCGVSVPKIIGRYIDQVNGRSEFTVNAPTMFAFVKKGLLYHVMGKNFGIAMAASAAMVLCALLWRCRERLTNANLVDAAFCMVMAVPYLLPHMSERYFFMADMLSLAYYRGERKRIYAPALVCFASFNSYLLPQQEGQPLSLETAAMLMLAALVLTGAQLAKDLMKPQEGVIP